MPPGRSRRRRRTRRTCRASRRTWRSSAPSRSPASARADRRRGGPQGLRLPELVGRPGLRGRRHLRRRHPQPRGPQQVDFIPAPDRYYHGEGAHVVSIDVPGFKGDILAVNDETYGSNVTLNSACAPADKTGGGFDLYDVSDPANPETLVQGAGDRDPDNDPATAPRAFANSYHSVFVWQDGPRAFLVASDNTELTDVDIFDITNPAGAGAGRRPRPGRAVPGDPGRRAGQRRRGLPARHGRQADRRQADPEGRLLGRGLRADRRQRPGQPGATSTTPRTPARIRCCRARPDAGGQRAPGRVLARQPVPAGRRRGLRPVPLRRARDQRADGRPAAPGDEGDAMARISDLPGPAHQRRRRRSSATAATRPRSRPLRPTTATRTRRRSRSSSVAASLPGGHAALRLRQQVRQRAGQAGWDALIIFNQIRVPTTAR